MRAEGTEYLGHEREAERWLGAGLTALIERPSPGRIRVPTARNQPLPFRCPRLQRKGSADVYKAMQSVSWGRRYPALGFGCKLWRLLNIRRTEHARKVGRWAIHEGPLGGRRAERLVRQAAR